jgi:hypothetical protein
VATWKKVKTYGVFSLFFDADLGRKFYAFLKFRKKRVFFVKSPKTGQFLAQEPM